MKLTREKLQNLWENREQIFNKESNKYIINRFERIEKIFEKINDFSDTEIKFKNESLPSNKYFACKEDGVTESGAYNGIIHMKSKFDKKYHEWIDEIACILGGFAFFENKDVNYIPPMIEDFRIISNTIIGHDDNGTLLSSGQSRHPSSHFADNNYFFNVINTIRAIERDDFDPKNTKLVLRWPTPTYYKGKTEEQIVSSQKVTLEYRFPYKFFYMWTHRSNCLHLVSLQAYKNLVQQKNEEIRYKKDKNINQTYSDFIMNDGWRAYSESIRELIPADKRGDNFYHDMSRLLSIIMIKDQDMKNMLELLETGNKAIILYGPPGTGKTYQAMNLIAQELTTNDKENIKELLEMNKFPNIGDKGTWTIVQFHPNYTYEDFIGGISPKLSDSGLSYELKIGIFKKFCDKAKEFCNKEKENKKFIMIIDEINRADLSSVFGELMYALEYRGASVSIPNFNEPFVIPANVYVIGTMNSIDKSLVTFDLALRRRFGFYKLMPQTKAIEDILSEYNIEENYLSKYIERCTELNIRISNDDELQLGSEYQIGQAYFGKVKDFLSEPNNDTQNIITILELEKLWIYHLEPLLQEYLGTRVEDKYIKGVIGDIRKKFTEPL